jgi:hypothetical protein
VGAVEEEIELYCRIYEKIRERLSKENPQEALNVALKIFEEVARDLRAKGIERRKKAKTSSRKEGNSATKRQREALHRFGVKDIPEDLSKKEASEILDRLVGFSKQGDSQSIAKLVGELSAKWKGYRQSG